MTGGAAVGDKSPPAAAGARASPTAGSTPPPGASPRSSPKVVRGVGGRFTPVGPDGEGGGTGDGSGAGGAAGGGTAGASAGAASKSKKKRERSAQGVDTHPFARSSVIEVLHAGSKSKKATDGKPGMQFAYDSTHGDTSDDDDDDSENGGGGGGFWSSDDEDAGHATYVTYGSGSGSGTGGSDSGGGGDPVKPGEERGDLPEGTSILLCDIIDRLPSSTPDHPLPEKRWKYYIHYRDYNRRMDEWITSDRIVSPPSVGGAKVRAMKKEEERRQREERLREEEERRLREEEEMELARQKLAGEAAAASADGAAAEASLASSRPRASRRSSNVSVGAADANGAGDDGEADAAALAAAGGGGGGGETRLTRRQRRKVTDGDVTNSSVPGSTGSPSPVPGSSAHRGSAAAGAAATTAGPSGHGPGAASGHGSTVAQKVQERVELNVVTTIAAQELDEHEGIDEAGLREHEEVTKVKNVSSIEMGMYRMETWYFSPLPKELLASCGGIIDILYVCEFTLSFFTRKEELLRFQAKELPRERRHPPGNEIYRKGNLSMFEVDGLQERIYCQNLCYIAKMFLDHKTLFFDVDPFLFYVLCEVDERGYHPVGYYSKEKYSDVGYNLACILTFPAHQRKGYGRFIIAFSYELSKKEEKVGSPEKPISDMGQKAYLPYWTSTVVDFLLSQSDESELSIMDISKRTSIMSEDIVFALNRLGILKFINGTYFIDAEREHLMELTEAHPVKEPRVDPLRLHWTPFITDVKRDKFSIHTKKASIQQEYALKETNKKSSGGAGYHRG